MNHSTSFFKTAINYCHWAILAVFLTLAAILFSQPVQAAAAEYSGESDSFTAHASMSWGELAEYTVKIKNTGTKSWKKNEVTFETGPALRTLSKFEAGTWINKYQPAFLPGEIAPGASATIKFALKAPVGQTGTIQENFQLVRAGKPISGTLSRLFIDLSAAAKSGSVSTNSTNNNASTTNSAQTQTTSHDYCIALAGDDPEAYSECNTSQTEESNTGGITAYKKSLAGEPNIRVGLFTVETAQRVTSESYYDVYAGSQLILSGLKPAYQTIVSFDFKAKQYIISTGGITKIVAAPVRFVPREKNGIMALLDYQHSPNWSNKYNDNQFRQVVEFQYSAKSGKLWVINELPISYYLKGLAETSESSPLEFQKVLATAARTYVLYHYWRGIDYGVPDGSTKHAAEHFHVDATYDQVYRGYGSEKRMPKFSQAVDETKGVIVTYQGDLAITPYFSVSDGRTRSWEEVWGGEAKPWLKSVSVPEDSGKELWGHGVGLSARGALVMARDEGKTWQTILAYFYSGTGLNKAY